MQQIIKLDEVEQQRRRAFIDAVAEFITSDLGSRSVKLQMGDKDAQRWAKMYQATGCTGYATKEQAVQAITELFL